MRGGRPFRPVAAVLALAAGLARASPPEAPAAPELADLIECRASYADMLALLPVAEDPLQAVARGWQPLPQANPFMDRRSRPQGQCPSPHGRPRQARSPRRTSRVN